MSITEFAAWWGAIVATLVLLWDIIKWRLAGPKLRLTVNLNMKPFTLQDYTGATLICAHVVNYGDRSTTLTHMAFVHYPNIWNACAVEPKKFFGLVIRIRTFRCLMN